MRRNCVEVNIRYLCAVNEEADNSIDCPSQWPHGLRRRSTAARLLRLWVRIPPGTCMSVVSIVLSGSGRRTDHVSRGVLRTVVRHCVRSRNLKSEEAMARVGPQPHVGGGMEH